MGLTRNYATTLYQWLSQFAPTFREPLNTTIFDANNPKPTEYITYSSDVSNFGAEFIQAITIYSQSTSHNKIMDVVDDIENNIGESGIRLSKDWGYITIKKGSPFYQDKPDEDDTIRAGYVNLLVNVYQFKV
jgi:hypothetical protein